MAESSSLWTTKQRIRYLDLPIKNFVENAIPYQVETLKMMKLNLVKVSILFLRNLNDLIISGLQVYFN